MLVPEQASVTVTGALEATSQVPGPASGSSATLNAGPSFPLSTPLEASSAGALATGPTLEAVELEELALRETLVIGGAGTVITLVTILMEEACAVLRVFFGSVVVVDVEVVVLVLVVVTRVRDDAGGGADWCSGVEPDDAVRVKTRTKRRMGLDHITQ
jgi:hypothetical protein